MRKNAELLLRDLRERIEARVRVIENTIAEGIEDVNDTEIKNRLKSLVWDVVDYVDEINVCYDLDGRVAQRVTDLRNISIAPLEVMLNTPGTPLTVIVPMTRGLIGAIDTLLSDMYGNYSMPARRYLGEIHAHATNRALDQISEYHVDIAGNAIDEIVRHLILMYDRPINYLSQTFQFDYPSISMMEDEPIKERTKFYAMYPGGFTIQAAERMLMEKVAIGFDMSTIVSNGCFDIVRVRALHDDPMIRITNEGKINPSKEEKQIDRTFRYLRDGGIAIITIPTFAITKKVSLQLAKYGRVVQMFMAPPSGSFDCSAVLVVQKCTTEKDQQDETFALIRNAFHVRTSRPTRFAELDLATDFSFGNFPRTVCSDPRIFKGGLPDNMAMIIALRSSYAYDIKEYVSNVSPKPLLPFNQGQVGLILSSGKLDGVIDEGSGFKHVIRGRVFKQRRLIKKFEERKTITDNDIVTITQRLNNCIEINLFAGDGTYKQIAVAN